MNKMNKIKERDRNYKRDQTNSEPEKPSKSHEFTRGGWFTTRFQQPEEKISKFEDRTIKMIKSENRKKND